MTEVLSSKTKVANIILGIPYLSDIINIVKKNGYNEIDLCDWMGVVYEESLLIDYDGYHPWDSRVHEFFNHLLDDYISIIYHRLRTIPERYLIESIISIKQANIESICIQCRIKETA